MNGKVKWVIVAVAVVVLAGAAISIFHGRGKPAAPTGTGDDSKGAADTGAVEVTGTWDGANLSELIPEENVRKIMGIRGNIQVDLTQDEHVRGCVYTSTEGKGVIVALYPKKEWQFPEEATKKYIVAGTPVFWVTQFGRLAAFSKGAWSVTICTPGADDELAASLKLAEVAIRRTE